MNNVVLMPAVVAQNNRAYDFSDAEEAVIIEDTPTEGSSVSFLEANTKRYLGLRQEEILETYDCLTF